MAESKFVIQGVDYPVVGWNDFDMGEAEILTAKTGLTLMDLSQGDFAMTPGLLATMMIVSYMRGNPNMTRARAEQVVSKVKLLDAVAHFVGDEDDAVIPPSVTPTPDEPESLEDSKPSSGDGSSTDSVDLPAVTQLPTGTPASDTPATSDLKASAS